ncbi:DUF3566 domain-containing protein [Gardnerella greenwoodii]|uniref:DUF3566 domain-containing protein n=1 Tax=Gardnerella greenwoodii 00703Dmash TaxID=698960 RepID=I4MB02_9BIFI|nr:DUF3566 domain-containing protein [Gardnerella greenwoodii]EIK86392.1 hypothetical protein CGSMWGv00703Dmash_00740 [Gardnerella greenwoodii 00703Dmash]
MSEDFEPSQNPTNINEESSYTIREDNNSNEEFGDSSLGRVVRKSQFTLGGSNSSSSSSRRTIGGMASSTSSASQLHSSKAGHTPRARRMSLSLVRVDAWSVAKVTFLLSVAGGIIQVIAAGLVWLFLNMIGVFDQVTQIVSSTGLDSNGFNLADVFSLPTVLSAVTIFSIVEIVIITILSAIIALLYNVVGSLVGGIHVTLGDD